MVNWKVKSFENALTFTGVENHALPTWFDAWLVKRNFVPLNTAFPFNAIPVTGLVGTEPPPPEPVPPLDGIVAATSFEYELSTPLAFMEVTT